MLYGVNKIDHERAIIDDTKPIPFGGPMKSLIFLLLTATSAFGAKATYTTENYNRTFSKGLVYPKGYRSPGKSYEYFFRDGSYPKSFHLKELTELAPIKDQKSCGSCVYFATTAAYEDNRRIRKMGTEILSPQFIMDCAQRQWMCGGSFFEYVAKGLVGKGGTALESEYPYRASNQSCKGSPKIYGKVDGFKIIDDSPKSIIAAMYEGKQAIAVTVGAGGAWGSYKSGVFNGCQGIGTNHEVVLVGYDCETSADAQGKCKFNSNGNLPNGVGIWHVRNSWGRGWGEDGYMRTKMTDSSGRKCNNLTEEAGILEMGDPVPPPEPKVFHMQSKSLHLKVTLSADAVTSVDDAKALLKTDIDHLEAK